MTSKATLPVDHFNEYRKNSRHLLISVYVLSRRSHFMTRLEKNVRFKKPSIGDREKVTMFLWYPVTIGRETRWMETATIEREYYHFGKAGKDGWLNCNFC